MRMNQRRAFLVASGAMLLSPRLAPAQQIEPIHRLGWLSAATGRTEAYAIAFVDRLRELGLEEGRNLVIELRAAQGRVERIPELAAELARLNCHVFFAAGGDQALTALERASKDTPIVMLAIDYDPVAGGHIASLARPGGRITGISQLQSDLPAKRLELLKELLPKARRIAVLSDLSSAGQLKVAQIAATRLGVELQVLAFQATPYDYESAFAEAARVHVEALLALASGLFAPARRQITGLALKHRLPSMFTHSGWAEAGGLLSYGPNFSSDFRRAAEQVHMILKGAKPADMPVEQPRTLELVINLKTAKTLGIAIGQSLRARIDRVIE